VVRGPDDRILVESVSSRQQPVAAEALERPSEPVIALPVDADPVGVVFSANSGRVGGGRGGAHSPEDSERANRGGRIVDSQRGVGAGTPGEVRLRIDSARLTWCSLRIDDVFRGRLRTPGAYSRAGVLDQAASRSATWRYCSMSARDSWRCRPPRATRFD